MEQIANLVQQGRSAGWSKLPIWSSRREARDGANCQSGPPVGNRDGVEVVGKVGNCSWVRVASYCRSNVQLEVWAWCWPEFTLQEILD